ncbi:hypothetical protein COOONC_11764, partial [Cooperia oncophora]
MYQNLSYEGGAANICTGRYVKKRVVTGTITITDKETKRQRPEFSSMPVDQFCLMRSHVVAALVAFTILSITQLFILLNCLHNRCRAGDTGTREDTISCSSNGTDLLSRLRVTRPALKISRGLLHRDYRNE